MSEIQYMFFKAGGLLLMLVGAGFGVIFLTGRDWDLFLLEGAVLSLGVGYAMFFRTLRVTMSSDRAVTLRGSGRTLIIGRADVLWAVQSGYPLVSRPLLLLRLRRARRRPSWILLFDDPVYRVLFVLRAWGVRGLGLPDDA